MKFARYFKSFIVASSIPLSYCLAQQVHYPFLQADYIKEISSRHSNLTVLDSQQTEHILTVMRNRQTNTQEFRVSADRLIRILIEQALSQLNKHSTTKESPIGHYDSKDLAFKDDQFCIVPILRAGNAFLMEAMKIIPGATVGQVLIQRNEKTADPIHYYSKFPENMDQKLVLLVDPMLATGGSAIMAIKILKELGVQEQNIIFINLVACEEGLLNVMNQYPNMKLITAQIDPVLIPTSKYIAPGIGDFGDRYFGTVKSH